MSEDQPQVFPACFAHEVATDGFCLFDMRDVLVEWYADHVVVRWMEIGGHRFGVGATTEEAFAALGRALLQEFSDLSSGVMPDESPVHPEVQQARLYGGRSEAAMALKRRRRRWWVAVSCAVSAAWGAVVALLLAL